MANNKSHAANVAQALPNISRKEYAKCADLFAGMFPSWEPQTMRDTILGVMDLARVEGTSATAYSYVSGAGVLQVHFDGKGGVMIDPESDFTPALLELGKALRLVMGDKLTVGRPGVTE